MCPDSTSELVTNLDNLHGSHKFETSHIFHVIDELRLCDLARAILDAKSYEVGVYNFTAKFAKLPAHPFFASNSPCAQLCL